MGWFYCNPTRNVRWVFEQCVSMIVMDDKMKYLARLMVMTSNVQNYFHFNVHITVCVMCFSLLLEVCWERFDAFLSRRNIL